MAAQMIISGKPCQPKDCASMVIESASLNLKYPFRWSFSTCARHTDCVQPFSQVGGLTKPVGQVSLV